MRGQEYIDELAGVVALPDRMIGTLMQFANRIKFYIDKELKKIEPDNGLIALLADAARVGWEQIEIANATYKKDYDDETEYRTKYCDDCVNRNNLVACKPETSFCQKQKAVD